MAPRLSGTEKKKGNLKNVQIWPESLGAMLEYWYIEHGLLKDLEQFQSSPENFGAMLEYWYIERGLFFTREYLYSNHGVPEGTKEV